MSDLKVKIIELKRRKEEFIKEAERVDQELQHLTLIGRLKELEEENAKLKKTVKKAGLEVSGGVIFYKSNKPAKRKYTRKKKIKQTSHLSAERLALADDNNPKHIRCHGLCGLNLPPSEFDKSYGQVCKQCRSTIQSKARKAKAKGKSFHFPTTGKKLLKCKGKLYGEDSCGEELPVYRFAMQPTRFNGRAGICKRCITRISKKHKSGRII